MLWISLGVEANWKRRQPLAVEAVAIHGRHLRRVHPPAFDPARGELDSGAQQRGVLAAKAQHHYRLPTAGIPQQLHGVQRLWVFVAQLGQQLGQRPEAAEGVHHDREVRVLSLAGVHSVVKPESFANAPAASKLTLNGPARTAGCDQFRARGDLPCWNWTSSCCSTPSRRPCSSLRIGARSSTPIRRSKDCSGGSPRKSLADRWKCC